MGVYHLAQINVARAIAPLDDPRMAGFAAQIEHMNAIGEASSGFVWRLTEDVHAYGDPLMLTNLTVWESVEDLRDFVYRGDHMRALGDRTQWFLRRDRPSLALWWIPAGHRPALEEGVARLDHLAAHGPSPVAFNFAVVFPAPAVQVEAR